MEGGNDNDNQNGNNGNYNYGNQNSNSNSGVDLYRSYWLGPMCSPKDGKSIFLAAFYDAGCTSYAGTGVYEAFNYGYSLPFESEPIVTLNDCISCLVVDEDNNNNNNNNNNNSKFARSQWMWYYLWFDGIKYFLYFDSRTNLRSFFLFCFLFPRFFCTIRFIQKFADNNNNNYNNYNEDLEVSELCQQSYEMAAKCETNLASYLGQYYYTDTTGCNYINNILPNLEAATRKITGGRSSSSIGGGSGAATACAVIFAMTSMLLGAYAFFLYRKIHRAKINLAQAEMGIN